MYGTSSCDFYLSWYDETSLLDIKYSRLQLFPPFFRSRAKTVTYVITYGYNVFGKKPFPRCNVFVYRPLV